MDESTRKIREYFGQHHRAYTESARHARGADLEELLAALDLAPGSQVLDAACGTGHTALAAAARGYHVTGMDMTPEMIDEGRGLATQRQLAVEWVVGDVHALPWEAGALDGVTCRRAAHHFQDLPRFLAECHRVIKSGGRVGISDMTAPQGAVGDVNRVERLRDDSHYRARSANEWAALMAGAGFNLLYLRVSEEAMTPEEWLSPVSPNSPQGRQALEFLQSPQLAHGIIVAGHFIKYRLVAVAEKP